MTWWQYLLLVNVYLLLFYGFYALLLRSETFFRLNRAYLVGSALLSFIIPLIQSDWLHNLFITRQINQTIYQLDMVSIIVSPQETTSNLNMGQILAAIYLIGLVVLLGRLGFQLAKLKQALNHPGADDAFSFFGKINVGKALSGDGIINAHEKVHARQWHSADVLLIELVTIINWFNPVVYLYRKAVKHIHEFIADNEIISSGTAKQEYAMLLLSQTFNAPVNRLANSFFNHCLLKQRIMMLHKNPSQRRALLKYGLSAPLFALMVVLSSATTKTAGVISIINKKAATVLELEPAAVINKVQKNTPGISEPTAGSAIETIKKEVDIKPAPLTVTVPDTTKDKIFTSAEQSAEFPGGLQAFGAFLASNIHYPAEAKKNNIQGRVICQFVVEKDGSLSDIKVVRGIGGGCDEEAVRVLSASPKWKPGKQNGIVIRQQYTVPIAFAIAGKPAKNQVMVTDVPLINGRVINVNRDTIKVMSPKSQSGNTTQRIIYGKECKNCVIDIDTTGKKYNMNLTGPKSPDFYLNDVLTDKKSLDKVPADNIESISVIKANEKNGLKKDQVRIITKK